MPLSASPVFALVRRLPASLSLLAACAITAAAQTHTPVVLRGDDPAATREQVLADAELLEGYARSSAYGSGLRARAAQEAERLRARLAQGDFRTGDRIFVRVSGSAELEDTLVVDDSLSVSLRSFGSLSLVGVLRSEAAARVRDRVRATALNADVFARPLLRLAVFGPVGAPGYLMTPMDARLDDVIRQAGGPLQTADPSRLRVVRGDVVALSSAEVRSAIVSGNTLAQLGLRDGDYLMLEPAPIPWDRASVLQIAGIIVAPLLTAVLLR